MNICNYGCKQEGQHQLKNGKWCCFDSPNKCPEMKRKNSEGGNRTYVYHDNGRKGIPSWNKGLTKENDERIKKISEKIKKTLKKDGAYWTGKNHTAETKAKMSKLMYERYKSGWESTSCGKAKKYKYTSPIAGEMTVDGKWELAVAKYLDNENIKWKRNTKRFDYTNLESKPSTYCPDFYIYDWECYIEVKGYETDKDRCKWKQFPKKLLIWKSDVLVEKKIIDKNGEVIELVKMSDC